VHTAGCPSNLHPTRTSHMTWHTYHLRPGPGWAERQRNVSSFGIDGVYLFPCGYMSTTHVFLHIEDRCRRSQASAKYEDWLASISPHTPRFTQTPPLGVWRRNMSSVIQRSGSPNSALLNFFSRCLHGHTRTRDSSKCPCVLNARR
jgi:hypothetical protein